MPLLPAFKGIANETSALAGVEQVIAFFTAYAMAHGYVANEQAIRQYVLTTGMLKVQSRMKSGGLEAEDLAKCMLRAHQEGLLYCAACKDQTTTPPGATPARITSLRQTTNTGR